MDNRLKEIRERLERATSGPWEYTDDEINGEKICGIIRSTNKEACYDGVNYCDVVYPNGLVLTDEDGVFIANSPADIEFLLEALEQAQKEARIAKLRKHVVRREYLNISEANSKRINQIYDLEQELNKSQDRERVLREALEFYADKNNYEDVYTDTESGCELDSEAPVFNDCGKIAREALK